MVSFTQQTFLGASISSYSCSAGWGNQTSSLEVTVVEDPVNGDAFTPGTIGTPKYFEYDDFFFGGILQSWTQSKSINGNPTYKISLESPTEILQGVQVIIDAYNGSTFGISNLMNAFGYWEDLAGFGGAQVNEGGMPWNLIKQAVLTLANGNGAINYRGHTYFLNLDELPATPDFYRIGGVNVSLLEAINQVAEDGGHDILVQLLTGNVINIKAVNRVTQPSLNAISSFISSSDNVNQSSVGREFRNEVTSSFLIGGNQTTLHQVEFDGDDEDDATIWPYWGVDANGNVIIGQGVNNDHTVTVDARAVNVVGLKATYTFDVLELRAAMTDQDTWETYLKVIKPNRGGPDKDIAQRIGLKGALFRFNKQLLQDVIDDGKPAVPALFKNLGQPAAAQWAQMDDNDWENNVARLYEFVRGYATEFYGKKFMVRVPFVVRKVEPETDRIIFSQEPTDAGFLPDGSAPLGLNGFNEEVFKNQDGRFEAFVKFDNPKLYDISDIDPAEAALQNGSLFIKAEVESNLVFVDGTPRAIITLNSVINTKNDEPDHLAMIDWILLAIEGNANQVAARKAKLLPLLKNRIGGHTNLPLGPFANQPSEAAVPMKSNVLTYGPWYVTGAKGKVRAERDESLVPWNYGGFAVMALAGNAKVQNGATFMMEGETGQLTEPGSPTANLGDTLVSGGPNITSISVDVGADGVKTSYTMKTYTPSFGRFSKSNIERLKRISISSQQQSRGLKLLLRRQALANARLAAREKVRQGLQNFKAPVRKVRKKDRADTVGAKTVPNKNGTKSATIASTGTAHESAVDSGADTSEFRQTAFMSQDGLYRPFAVDSLSSIPIPKYQDAEFTTTGALRVRTTPSVSDLNPLRYGHDICIVSRGSGNDYEDPHNDELTSSNALNQKGIAHRLPMVGAGWGWTQEGIPYPNDGTGAAFVEDWLEKGHNWFAGPIDLRWDDNRKMWSSWVGRILVTFTSDLSTGGTATATIDALDGTAATLSEKTIVVSNPLGQCAKSGQKAIVGWDFAAAAFIPIQVQFTQITVVSRVDCVDDELIVCDRSICVQGEVTSEDCGDSSGA